MLGINAKMYRNSGTYGSPSWAEVADISDLTLNPAFQETKFGTRASRIGRSAKTLSDLTYSGKIKVDLDEADYIAFRDAHLSPDGVLDLMILTGGSTTNGVWGYRGEFQVNITGQDQGLNAKMYDDFTLAPSDTDNAFTKAIVASGSAAFTAV